MISARMRDGLGWSDARILNMSSRGLLLHAQNSPARGSYIEVAKGPHRMVARVVWVRKERFGVQTQDKVPPEIAAAGGEAPAREPVDLDKLLKPRERPADEELEQSHSRARAIQFAWVMGLAVAGAMFAFDTIGAALSQPLSVVSAELVRKQ